MSKLAHSHQPTMNALDFMRAVADGNEDVLAGFWWVRHQGELRVAEFRNYRGKWEWDFTRAETAKAVDAVIEFILPPQEPQS